MKNVGRSEREKILYPTNAEKHIRPTIYTRFCAYIYLYMYVYILYVCICMNMYVYIDT